MVSRSHHIAPAGREAMCQKTCDSAKVAAAADPLLNSTPDAISHARLQATIWGMDSCLIVFSLGLRMIDSTIRIAIGFCLDTPLCQPHLCHHCGAQVTHFARLSIAVRGAVQPLS